MTDSEVGLIVDKIAQAAISKKAAEVNELQKLLELADVTLQTEDGNFFYYHWDWVKWDDVQISVNTLTSTLDETGCEHFKIIELNDEYGNDITGDLNGQDTPFDMCYALQINVNESVGREFDVKTGEVVPNSAPVVETKTDQSQALISLLDSMGVEYRSIEGDTGKSIDFLDSEGNKAELNFDQNGQFVHA